MDDERLYGNFSDKDFKRLSVFVYDNYGINLYPAKKVLVKSRINRRLAALGIDTYEQYCDFVLSDGNDGREVMEMIDRITTNKTEFFREADHFDLLKNKLLQSYQTDSGKSIIKIWCAGCSSGEEPYTLAMVLSEYRTQHPGFDFSIVASDISTTMLRRASKAVYEISSLQQIPAEYRSKYLLKSKNPEKKLFRIAPQLRNKVKFFRHNLLDGQLPVSTAFDFVFCRNTLIYFDRQTQESVVTMIFKHVVSNGYLFLGHSESLVNMNFSAQHIASAVYKKMND